ncbi:hypothetical protein, partial [uncultured Bacteroides sp.]|uniref:hypothetical protein n=1 Tax=uncultured Bacteroides sp. TaxID=162156 RepID=UPI0025ADD140
GEIYFRGGKNKAFASKRLVIWKQKARFNRGLNQVIGRGKTKGEKGLKMNEIEKRGGLFWEKG